MSLGTRKYCDVDKSDISSDSKLKFGRWSRIYIYRWCLGLLFCSDCQFLDHRCNKTIKWPKWKSQKYSQNTTNIWYKSYECISWQFFYFDNCIFMNIVNNKQWGTVRFCAFQNFSCYLISCKPIARSKFWSFLKQTELCQYFWIVSNSQFYLPNYTLNSNRT